MFYIEFTFQSHYLPRVFFWGRASSVGLVENRTLLDLKYDEDSSAEVDMNVVMFEDGTFVEVQGTAEGQTFSRTQLDNLLDLAEQGVLAHIAAQKQALGNSLQG